MKVQIALCGKDLATSGRRVASFNISSMMIPRNASRDISRSLMTDLVSDSLIAIVCGGFSTCTPPIRAPLMCVLVPSRPESGPLSGKAISLGPSFPVVARKVWEFLRSPTRGHRCLAQRGRRTPSSRIVDVDVGRQASFKAVHQPEVHDVIHPPVSTRLARHLAIVLP